MACSPRRGLTHTMLEPREWKVWHGSIKRAYLHCCLAYPWAVLLPPTLHLWFLWRNCVLWLLSLLAGAALAKALRAVAEGDLWAVTASLPIDTQFQVGIKEECVKKRCAFTTQVGVWMVCDLRLHLSSAYALGHSLCRWGRRVLSFALL